jgi:hypothetical protein
MLALGRESDDEFVKKLGAGFVVCTAGGKVLADNVAQGLAAFDKLPEAERKPPEVLAEKRGPINPKKDPLQPPPGGLIVRVFQRVLDRDAEGELFTPPKMDLGGGNWVPAEPGRDFLWLTEADWQSLVPDRPNVGDVFPVPAPVRNRIFRFHLANNAAGLAGVWDRGDLRSGDLKLTVEEATPDAVRLRLDGEALLADKADRNEAARAYAPRISGRLQFDTKQKLFTRFDVVAVGEYDWRGKVDGKVVRRRYPFGVCFELATGDSAADRRPPYGSWIDLDRARGLHTYLTAEP